MGKEVLFPCLFMLSAWREEAERLELCSVIELLNYAPVFREQSVAIDEKQLVTSKHCVLLTGGREKKHSAMFDGKSETLASKSGRDSRHNFSARKSPILGRGGEMGTKHS